MIETETPIAARNPHTLKISRLSNSIYFFLDAVLILQDEGGHGYRLIFYHTGEIIVDLPFATVRGARIAFSKYCEKKAYSKEVKADWTEPYRPEKDWLDQILSSPRNIKIEHKKPKDVLGGTQ